MPPSLQEKKQPWYILKLISIFNFTGMDQSLKQESVRMRSTIQSLISSTPMIRTMPTTVTRSMNLRKAKLKNHLQRCPRSCNRQCNRLSSFPKKYDGALDLSFSPLPIYCEWPILSCILFFPRRCRWFRRPLSPKNLLLNLSSLQIHPLYQHSTWMSSSSLPSLLLATVVSFSLSSCRKSRGTTSLTFCALSTVSSTTSPNSLSSTPRWL